MLQLAMKEQLDWPVMQVFAGVEVLERVVSVEWPVFLLHQSSVRLELLILCMAARMLKGPIVRENFQAANSGTLFLT
jgi:hypothetical protein